MVLTFSWTLKISQEAPHPASVLPAGMKLFFFVSIIVLVIILPINITGTEVDKLMEVGIAIPIK